MASIYTAALMEHNAHPDYKYQMDEPTCTHDGVNPSCGDELTLSLRLRGDRIEEAAFTGHLENAGEAAGPATGKGIGLSLRVVRNERRANARTPSTSRSRSNRRPRSR